MSVLMTPDKKEMIVDCKCGCQSSFHIVIDDMDCDLYGFLGVMRNSFDTEYQLSPWRAFKTKCRKIWSILRNKDYYYSDTVMSKADFEEFKRYINKF